MFWILILAFLGQGVGEARASDSLTTTLLDEAKALAQNKIEKDETLRLWTSLFSRYVDARAASPDFYAYKALSQWEKAALQAHHPKLEFITRLLEPEMIIAQDEVMAKSAKVIWDQVHDHPEALKKIIQDIHQGDQPIGNEILDQLFGIEYDETEETIPEAKYADGVDYKGLREDETQTGYYAIRKIFRELPSLGLHDGDHIYDLGSGYGRVLLYGGICLPKVQFKGVEIVAERADVTRKIAKNVGLKNVTVETKDVLQADYSDGQVFYLFNPFTQKIFDRVIERLHAIALKRKILIIGAGKTGDQLADLPWLKQVKRIAAPQRPMIYESVKIAD